jgi:APA family basic amino acid/polyamine antiporter
LAFWQIFPGNSDNQGKAVALLAQQVPYWGALAQYYVPLLGAILLLISSNSGVFGSSRIAYAMSNAQLLPSAFRKVHARFRTPVISIVTFCLLAVVELIFAALPGLDHGARAVYARLFHGEDGITFLGDLYAFGAATSYSFVFIALIALRLFDPLSPRKFKMPLNIPLTVRGQRVEFPVIAVLGFIGIVTILAFTLLTHDIGRVAGPSWLAIGIVLYLFYRRQKRLPAWSSRPHDWRGEQVEILRNAGELELMDEYVHRIRSDGAAVERTSV